MRPMYGSNFSIINKGKLQWAGLFLVLIFSFQACDQRANESANEKTIVVDTSSIEFQINKLTNEIEISPDNYELYYQRSLLWYDAGNTQKAIEDVDKSINRFVDAPHPYHLRGFYAYVQNDDDKALLFFQRAADQGSENPETYYSTGQIHFLRRNFEEAEKWYQTAIELDPDDPTYPFAIGFLKENQEELEAAIEWYEKALIKDPAFVKALSRLYEINLNVKDNPKAAMAFNERILKADSLHPVGHFNQGTYYFNLANSITDEARQSEFQMLLKLAVAEYSKSIFADPNYAKAWYNRGYCFFLLDRINEAMTDFEKVLEIDPHNEKALFMRGSIFEYYGDLSNALENYKEALRIDPGFSDAQIAVNEVNNKLEH